MALPKTLTDREYQKFTLLPDGTPAVKTTASVTIDSMSLEAEMKVDSGHDLYEADSVTRTADLAISFTSITGLTLAKIQSVENKTKGWIYSTKGATVTTTAITLVAGNQKSGYPVIAVADEVEVIYRGASRFDDKAKDATFTGLLNEVNLNAVIAATDGASVATHLYSNKTVYVSVSVNTGAVTVNIESSPDGTNWYNFDSKTYTAVTGNDSWEVKSHFPFMRTTTTSLTDATVTTTITGRGL